jgi:predicted transcriptional regulator
VYTDAVKNITLSADEDLIERARQVAREQHKTLNEMFREWLAQVAGSSDAAAEYRELMDSLGYVNAGRHFSREELNER